MPRLGLDLSVYLVTDTVATARHGLTAVIEAATAGGVTVVQLRDTDATDEEFVGLGMLVSQALRGTSVPFIINDRVHLVARIGADGAHIGQGDVDPLEARSLLGGRAYLGLTCSTPDQVREASALPAGTLDYLGLGPVWSTPHTTEHAAPVGVHGLTQMVREARLPSVGIGGITVARAGEVIGTGVSGVAVSSAICRASDPRGTARALAAQVAAAR